MHRATKEREREIERRGTAVETITSIDKGPISIGYWIKAMKFAPREEERHLSWVPVGCEHSQVLPTWYVWWSASPDMEHFMRLKPREIRIALVVVVFGLVFEVWSESSHRTCLYIPGNILFPSRSRALFLSWHDSAIGRIDNSKS